MTILLTGRWPQTTERTGPGAAAVPGDQGMIRERQVAVRPGHRHHPGPEPGQVPPGHGQARFRADRIQAATSWALVTAAEFLAWTGVVLLAR